MIDVNCPDISVNYIRAKHASCQILNQCYVTSLPVNLHQIVDTMHYTVHSYQKSHISQLLCTEEIEKDGDGFIIGIDGEKHIYINDKKQPIEQRKYTLAHEIGHGVLNHPIDNILLSNSSEKNNSNRTYEYEADIFAKNLLAPTCILHALNIYTSDEITQLCNVPASLADIKSKKMYELKKIGFQACSLERELLNNFKNFIKIHKP